MGVCVCVCCAHAVCWSRKCVIGCVGPGSVCFYNRVCVDTSYFDVYLTNCIHTHMPMRGCWSHRLCISHCQQRGCWSHHRRISHCKQRGCWSHRLCLRVNFLTLRCWSSPWFAWRGCLHEGRTAVAYMSDIKRYGRKNWKMCWLRLSLARNYDQSCLVLPHVPPLFPLRQAITSMKPQQHHNKTTTQRNNETTTATQQQQQQQ